MPDRTETETLIERLDFTQPGPCKYCKGKGCEVCEHTGKLWDVESQDAVLADAIAHLRAQQEEIERLTPKWVPITPENMPKRDTELSWWRRGTFEGLGYWTEFDGRRLLEIKGSTYLLTEFSHWSPIIRPEPVKEGE